MEIKEITGDNFQTEVIEANRPTLLMFYADGCSRCKAQFPILKKAAEEACDVTFCKVNAGTEMNLAAAYGVEQVPTMIILNGKQIFQKVTGVRPLEEILGYLEM